MKKVNLLLGALYANTLILAVPGVYFFKSGVELFWVLKTHKEPDFAQFDTMPAFFEQLFERLPIIFLIWLVVHLALSVINIAALIFDYKNNSVETLFRKMKRVKMGLIPYWIANFVCYISISWVALLVGHGFGFVLVLLFIFASYTVLIVTSIFSTVYLSILRKNKVITKKQLIIHIILQMFFVLDVADTIYIIKRWGRAQP